MEIYLARKHIQLYVSFISEWFPSGEHGGAEKQGNKRANHAHVMSTHVALDPMPATRPCH